MEEKNQWVSVYESNRSYQAEIILKLLASNEIDAAILDKEDRSYVGIGLGIIKVMVKEEDKVQALSLINTGDHE